MVGAPALELDGEPRDLQQSTTAAAARSILPEGRQDFAGHSATRGRRLRDHGGTRGGPRHAKRGVSDPERALSVEASPHARHPSSQSKPRVSRIADTIGSQWPPTLWRYRAEGSGTRPNASIRGWLRGSQSWPQASRFGGFRGSEGRKSWPAGSARLPTVLETSSTSYTVWVLLAVVLVPRAAARAERRERDRP
jgi:hypothetical protein